MASLLQPCARQIALRPALRSATVPGAVAFRPHSTFRRPPTASFFGLGPKPKLSGPSKGRYGELLSWARQASTMSCPVAPTQAPAGQDMATFAGGCFWGLELAYQRQPGVTHTSVGYIGGQDPEPDYRKVCSGRTGHAEAVQVYFKPQEVSYEQLLDLFFDRVDPTTLNRQGNDAGTQYRSAIYFHNDAQKAAAQKKIDEVNQQLSKGMLPKKVVTELTAFDGKYYTAEEYHQQYLEKGGQRAEKGASDRIRCYG